MSLFEKMNESQKEIDSIGQSLYEMNEIVDALTRHLEKDGEGYNNDQEALEDVQVLKNQLNEIHKKIYGGFIDR